MKNFASAKLSGMINARIFEDNGIKRNLKKIKHLFTKQLENKNY